MPQQREGFPSEKITQAARRFVRRWPRGAERHAVGSLDEENAPADVAGGGGVIEEQRSDGKGRDHPAPGGPHAYRPEFPPRVR